MKRIISNCVIKGTFYTIDNLTAPLHDLVHLNLASILRELEPGTGAVLQRAIGRPRETLIGEHQHNAISTFRELVGRDPPDESSVRTLHTIIKNHDNSHARALQTKIQAKYRDNEIDPESANEIYQRIVTNTQALPARIPAKHRLHAFLVIHNALMRIGEHTQQQKAALLCSFCGEALERARHIFGECRTIRAAAMHIVRQQSDKQHFLILHEADWDDYRFRTTAHPAELAILLNFSLAIWRSRMQFTGEFTNRTPINAVHCISAIFQNLYNTMMAKKTRRRRDRQGQKAEFMRNYVKLPDDSARAFTDGSSYRSGAAGAGYTYCLSRASRQCFSSVNLGMATNNVAELKAIELLCDEVRQKLVGDSSLPRLPLFVFSDNKYALAAIDDRIKTRANLSVIRATRNAVLSLRQLVSVTLDWVPAHAGVQMNETADKLAKRGANGETSHRIPVAANSTPSPSLSSSAPAPAPVPAAPASAVAQSPLPSSVSSNLKHADPPDNWALDIKH